VRGAIDVPALLPRLALSDSTMISMSLLLAGFLLSLYVFVAFLPIYWAFGADSFRQSVKSLSFWGAAFGGLLVSGAVLAFFGYNPDTTVLEERGRQFASILHKMLIVDFFILAPEILLLVWPKGGAVALAAFREGWRQPMFWVLAGAGALAITVSMVIPYFTFGDDYKMMKQLGFDTVMLFAVLFAVLASSISINEEIEGRTAITVISKPITRRQFLIGKYFGILLAAAGLTLILSYVLNWALHIKPMFDKLDEVKDQMPLQVAETLTPFFMTLIPGAEASSFAVGVSAWFSEVFAHGFGMLLGFGQVMVLLAISTALATRMSFIINIVICGLIFLLGHLSPILVQVTQNIAQSNEGSPLVIVGFLAQLFDAVLPALEFFNMGPAIIRDNTLDFWPFATYVLTVFGYAVIYSVIGLLIGLILFEDRDLA